MTLEELERVIIETVAHLQDRTLQMQDPNDAVALGLSTSYYLVEVIRRSRTKGLSRRRTCELAVKAVERRIRNEASERLGKMLEGVDSGFEGAEEGAEPAVLSMQEGTGGLPESEGGAGGADMQPPQEADGDDAGPDGGERAEGGGGGADSLPPEPVTERPTPGELSYTICAKCGRIGGNMVAGAKRIIVPACGECGGD